MADHDTDKDHPTHRYAYDVASGKIVAGPIVRAACERHIRDLKEAPKRGFTFSFDRADHILDFYPLALKLNGGQFEDKPFILEPPQQFIVGSIFGWVDEEGNRRFRVAYIEMGKGNGKALAIDTPIPTPSGWTKMSNIQAGDQVLDDCGKPCNVTAVTDVMYGRQCYRVGFSDGSEIVADADHLWRTRAYRSESHGRVEIGRAAIRTTAEIANSLKVSPIWSDVNHFNHRVAYGGKISLPINLSRDPKFCAEEKTIVSCDPVESVPVKCISVDSPSRMFLAGEHFVPTHNSPLLGGIGIYCLIADDEPRAEVYSAAPLALDTLVPTPNGWTTQGQLRVGDYVFDQNGDACMVTYLSPILNDRECFEVEFDDGTVVVSDANHRWLTNDTRGQSPAHYQEAVVTTEQISKTLRSAWGRLRHRIGVAAALNLPQADLPIDPYTLGVWLGDGRSNRGCICSHKDDVQHLDLIRSAGYEISPMASQNDTRYCTVRGLRTQLRDLGLLDNKHVPCAYLRASYEQRRSLLCGLMDTDGTCSKSGECKFTNRNRNLAQAVHELATGLGIRAGFNEIEVTGSPYWTVSFKAPKDIRVFNLDRKFARQRDFVDTRAKARYIRDVRPCKSVPVRCIEVNSDSHLYLVTRSHIATHNTKKDQAMILFRDAVAMVDQSDALSERLVKSGKAEKCWNLFDPDTNSFFRPISSDDGQSGPRPHCGLIDELHEHKTPTVINMMTAGQKFRRQPIVMAITNSGSDKKTPCGEYHDKAIRVCSGIEDDDRFFAYVCALDKGEDPFKDESCWVKANPLLGTLITKRYLRDQIQAATMPSKESSVRRLNFCEWTQADNPFVSFDAWTTSKQVFDLSIFKDRRDIALGLDLSQVSDLTAAVFTGRVNGKTVWWAEFWIPEDMINVKVKEDKIPYDVWKRKGWIRTTPGKTISLRHIAKDLKDMCSKFNIQIRDAPYDRWRIEDFKTALDDVGFTMLREKLSEFGQGFKDMTPAIDAFEKSLLNDGFAHPGNPILDWCAANAVVREDPAGGRKLDKSKDRKKRIDGIVAGVMSHHSTSLVPEAPKVPSIRWM